jgi:hypothetical protein
MHCFRQGKILTKSSRWIVSIENDRLNAGDLSTDGKSAVNVPNVIATIKDFLRFKASIGEGRIDEELELATADSLNAFAEWFFARFARVPSNFIPKEDRQEVYDVSAPKVE